MYHIIYKVVNKINDKSYIGYHQTNDINDEYLGSGKLLKKAIKKYGKENFAKEILYVFPNKDEALLKEAEIVNTEFVNDKTTYNLKVGGEGGWDYINTELRKDDKYGSMLSKKLSTSIKKAYKEGKLNSSGMNNPMYGKWAWNKGIKGIKGIKGKSLSLKTKEKISKNNGNKLNDDTIECRLLDLKNTDKTRGYISKLAKKWNVSHTQVRRFIKKFNN